MVLVINFNLRDFLCKLFILLIILLWNDKKIVLRIKDYVKQLYKSRNSTNWGAKVSSVVNLIKTAYLGKENVNVMLIGNNFLDESNWIIIFSN